MRRLLAKLLSRKPDRTGADRCGQETRTALPCAAPLRKAGPALRPGRCEHSLPGREGQKPGGGRREGKRKKKKKRGRQAADPAGRSPPARSAAMVSGHRRAEVPRRGRLGVREAGGPLSLRADRRALREAGAAMAVPPVLLYQRAGGRCGGHEARSSAAEGTRAASRPRCPHCCVTRRLPPCRLYKGGGESAGSGAVERGGCCALTEPPDGAGGSRRAEPLERPAPGAEHRPAARCTAAYRLPPCRSRPREVRPGPTSAFV